MCFAKEQNYSAVMKRDSYNVIVLHLILYHFDIENLNFKC